MQPLRAFLLRHNRLAIVVVGLALAIRALVPTGYMPPRAGKVLIVTICDGTVHAQGALRANVALAIPPAAAASGKLPIPGHEATGSPCAFAGLALGGLTRFHPAPLAVATAPPALPHAGHGTPFAIRAPLAHLRPPLRGPPGLV